MAMNTISAILNFFIKKSPPNIRRTIVLYFYNISPTFLYGVPLFVFFYGQVMVVTDLSF